MSVYFARQAPPSADRVKIGYTSTNAKDRLAGLQTGSACELWLLGVVEGAERGLERALHKKLAPHRVMGEWFRPAPEVVRELWNWVGDESLTPQQWWRVSLGRHLMGNQASADRNRYVLRWPDHTATVLEVESLVELWRCADELGNPNYAEFAPYHGPMAMAFRRLNDPEYPDEAPEDRWLDACRSGTEVDNDAAATVRKMLDTDGIWHRFPSDVCAKALGFEPTHEQAAWLDILPRETP